MKYKYNNKVHNSSFGTLVCNHAISLENLEKVEDSVNCEACIHLEKEYKKAAKQIADIEDAEILENLEEKFSKPNGYQVSKDFKLLSFSFISSYVYEWAPKNNITPYEIAICLPIVISLYTYSRSDVNLGPVIKNLPEKSQRHFKKVKNG